MLGGMLFTVVSLCIAVRFFADHRATHFWSTSGSELWHPHGADFSSGLGSALTASADGAQDAVWQREPLVDSARARPAGLLRVREFDCAHKVARWSPRHATSGRLARRLVLRCPRLPGSLRARESTACTQSLGGQRSSRHVMSGFMSLPSTTSATSMPSSGSVTLCCGAGLWAGHHVAQRGGVPCNGGYDNSSGSR